MMTALRAAILAALLFPAALAAQDVTITARDGALEIVGTMRGYDGDVYRVETGFGLLTVDAQGVVCAGPGCPDLTAFVAEAEVAGAASIGQGLFQTLVAGFAEDHGLALSLARDAAGDVTQTLSDTGPAGARVLVRLHHRPGTSDAGLAALDAGQADLALA
ncbi:MAG: cell envelope biogenesis protein OmpA, partial [Rhodobacteraceae bacterium]|nr:cell envelope biogenesis protein OmpA [Paracoccaceae bacterium]